MKKLLFLFLLLIPLALPSHADAQTWPGQCPVGTAPNAIGCVPEAVTPVTTDLTYCWQVDQEPKTRACQFGQILAAGLAAIFSTINAVSLTLTGSLTVPTAVIQILSGSTVYAAYYGVVADAVVSSVPGSTPSGTSNDQALGLALYACDQNGYRLVLPAGPILLTGASLTGNATRLVQNCFMQGAGAPAAQPGVLTGTTFVVTSTSVGPFVGGNGFGMADFNIYWPGQTGAVVYPPFLTDGGPGTIMANGNLHNVNWINAWDGVAQSTCATVSVCAATGNIKFSDMTIFAAHDDFRVTAQGDGWAMSNIRVLPAAWLNFCNHSSPCNAAVGQASGTEAVFHAANPTSGSGGTMNMNAINIVNVGCRYGILVDSQEGVSESHFVGTWDACGTVLDTSSGGFWAFGNVLIGDNAACYIPGAVWGVSPPTGNEPCFNIGSSGEFDLVGFLSSGSQGDFLDTAGATIHLNAVASYSIGSVQDGGNYYQVNIMGGTHPDIRVQNSEFSGINGSANVHGFNEVGSSEPSVFVAEGNVFRYLNDDITMTFPQQTIIGGNYSDNTFSSQSFVQLNTSTAIVYYGNNWDKQPQPTLANCGTTPPAIPNGDGPNSGNYVTGSGTVNSCQVIMPIYIFGTCQFTDINAVTVGASPSGTPPTWTVSTYVGASPESQPSTNFFYQCTGQQ